MFAFQPTEDEVKEQLTKLSKECAAKTDFSEENIKKLQAHDFTDTENVQCYKKCVMDQSGLITENGIDETTLLKFAKAFKKEESLVKTTIEKCQPLYKKDSYDCNAAWEIFKCLHPKE